VRPQCLIDTASSQRGERAMGGGQRYRGLVLHADGAYHRRPAATADYLAPARYVTGRRDDVLTGLHVLGCKQQFEAWMRERAATENRPTPAPGFLELSYATQHVHRLLCRRRPH